MIVNDISPNVKGLIFDLDGTLINTMPYHFEAWQKAAADYGMSMTKEFLENLMGGSAVIIAQKLTEYHNKTEINHDELIKCKGDYYKKLVCKVTRISEVFALVEKYHGKLPMAIGTGGSRSSVGLSLKQTGIAHYFDFIVTANDVENHKPAPDTFLKCAELIGIEPQFCEVFEDGDPGLLAAENAGMIATDVRNWFDPKW